MRELTKQLFGQVPVLGSGPATDIGWRIERRDKDPRVGQHVFAFERIQRRGDVASAAHAPEPALAGPAREQLGSGLSVKGEGLYDIIDLDDIASGADHHGESPSAARKASWIQAIPLLP